MKIIHLIDDWGFADGPIEAFKSFPVTNKFVVLRFDEDKKLTKVKCVKDVSVVQIGSDEYQALIHGDWDVVWVHGYKPEKGKFIAAVDNNAKVVWSTWGFDYVQYSGQWPYGLRTTAQWLYVTSLRTIVGTLSRLFVGRLGVARFLPRAECRFFRRVNYYSSVVPTERSYLERILGRSVRQITFHYIGTKKDCEQEYPKVFLGNKRIWIGNSATLTNNHLDVFHRLKGRCEGYDVLTPVSYTLAGEVRDVVTEMIESAGMRNFGDHYKPVREYMSFDKYVRLMSTCSIFVFGHKRQQSVGNLVIALRCGGCVFMDSDSPVYKYFSSIGIVIYPLARLSDGVATVVKEFSLRQAHNIALMLKLRGDGKLIDEIRESVDYLRRAVCGEEV